MRALGTVDQDQVADPIAHDRPVAQLQLGLARHRHAHLGQRVGVGRQLQQGSDGIRGTEDGWATGSAVKRARRAAAGSGTIQFYEIDELEIIWQICS